MGSGFDMLLKKSRKSSLRPQTCFGGSNPISLQINDLEIASSSRPDLSGSGLLVMTMKREFFNRLLKFDIKLPVKFIKGIHLFLYQMSRPEPRAGYQHGRPKVGTDGFTLLELVIVIVLITLVIGIATIFFANTLSTSKFNTTIRDISSTIRDARSLAQIHGEQKAITIDLDSKTYWVEGKKVREIPSDIQIKIIDPLYGEIFEGKYQIVSNALGGVAGGTIVLWNEKKTVSIQPDPIVGSVVVK